MGTSKRMSVVAVVLTASLFAWSSPSAAADAPQKEKEKGGGASHVSPIEGSKLKRVVLTKKAAERLDIKTAPVAADGIPYGALIYDVKGMTWVYTNPEPLAYVRHAVTVDSIKSGRALVKDGPPAGTLVVVVGAAELYGAELGTGH